VHLVHFIHLISRGNGAWVPFTVILVGLMFETLAALSSVKEATAHANSLAAIILVVSAGVVFLIARRVSGSPRRVVNDRSSGTSIQNARHDDFFFIPLEFWPRILLVVALIFVVVGAIRGRL
jgi:hypothetical protein